MRVRVGKVCALALGLCACGVASGGLDPDPLTYDAGEDTLPPLDASLAPSTAEDAAKVDEAEDASPAVGSQDDGAVIATDAAKADATMLAADASLDACTAAGTYALNIEADVHWEGIRLFGIVPVIVAGDGKLSVQNLIEVGADHALSLRACGTKLPTFSSSLGELYAADFPDEVWEKLALRFAARANITCTSVNCGFRTDPIPAQLGIDIPGAQAWPTSRDVIPANVQRDDDLDGLPGVRVVMRGPEAGPGFKHPPTSIWAPQRVAQIELAIRIESALDGTIDSCDARSGPVKGMTISIRALGCTLDNGTACSDAELGFIDDNLPVWTVKAARFVAQRVPANTSCAEVRSTLAMIGSL